MSHLPAHRNPHPGGKRVRGCACEWCDPDQLLVAAARARARAAKEFDQRPPNPPPAPTRPRPTGPDWHGRYLDRVRRMDADRNTRRMRELLKAGHTFAEAAQIIESETK